MLNFVQYSAVMTSNHSQTTMADFPTEWERQLTTAHANQTIGMTNDRTANCAPEVTFSPFRALSRRQWTFLFGCLTLLYSVEGAMTQIKTFSNMYFFPFLLQKDYIKVGYSPKFQLLKSFPTP